MSTGKTKAYSVTQHPRYKEARELAGRLRGGLNESRKEIGAEISDVLAMSQGSDPYWMTTGKILKAYWAQDVVNNTVMPFLISQGLKNMHLRDIHYTLTGSEGSITWNGEEYMNSDKHWGELIEAFANARYLKLFEWKLIRDNKNEFYHRTSYRRPKTFAEALDLVRENLEPEVVIKKLIEQPFKDMLNIWNFQPVHVEIWAEKDLALLEKICKAWSLNAVVGEGETSITQVLLLVDRLIAANKPARIAYISDCDVVGSNMVKAMARKVEYFLMLKGSKLDVRVIPLMATPEQVEELGLPTKPHKKGKKQAYDTRVQNWLDTRGMDGAVEVNTIHAIHPEFFKDTIEDFIQEYVDVDKWNEVIDMRKAIPKWVTGHLDETMVDVSSLDAMIEAVDWDDIELDHSIRVDNMGESELDYDQADKDHNWLLSTTLEYGDQLEKYQEFDDGDL